MPSMEQIKACFVHMKYNLKCFKKKFTNHKIARE